jgi:hypothetical protein
MPVEFWGNLLEKEVSNGTGGRKIPVAQSTIIHSASPNLNLFSTATRQHSSEIFITRHYKNWLDLTRATARTLGRCGVSIRPECLA